MEKIDNQKLLQFVGERDNSIDFAKAFLIFLVVWGHSIQCLHGTSYDYWEDPIFKFIYGFHMPLFALISGYLMSGSFKRYSARALIGKRAKKLLIPTIGWALVLTVVDVMLNILTHESNSLAWIVGRFLSRTVNDLWFLKAMFIGFIVVVFIEKLFKGNWFAYVICSLLTFLLPSIYNFNLYGFVLPFFVLGFKVVDIVKKWNETKSRKVKIGIFASSIIVYIVMLLFFSKDNYIYTTGLSILNSKKGVAIQLGLDIYRMATALFGCIMMLELSSLVTKNRNWIKNISCKTMIIYIVTTSIFTYIPQLMQRVDIAIVLPSVSAMIINILLIPITVVLGLVALLAEFIIKRIKLEKILLGI